MNDAKISISRNQMFVVFKTNNETVTKGFHALILESKYFYQDKKVQITYVLSQCINLNFIDDHCQYWLNKADGTLTSPNFGVNDLGNYHFYDHNSNCTWILNADQGYYIKLEIEHFGVNHNNTYDIYFYKFFNKVHHYSFLLVTFYQSMMDQIFNHHQYQNWLKVSMIIKKVFQVLDLTYLFNL